VALTAAAVTACAHKIAGSKSGTAAVKAAAALALALVLHQSAGVWRTPKVYLSDLGQAFHWANYARLKTYPGAEGKRGALLDLARDLFFDPANWEEVVKGLPDSPSRSEAIDFLSNLGNRSRA
jgi:hypothetical protein